MSALPSGFTALAPFEAWALPTERARHAAIRSSSLAEVRRFYDAMLPLLPPALDHLNGFALDTMPAAERRLLDLCLAMVEAAAAVENFAAADPPHLMPLDRFVPMHDQWSRATEASP